MSVTKYQELITKKYKEVLIYEIEANKCSYVKNNSATIKANKRYLQGVGLTTIAILISIILLLVSTFMEINKAPTKVQVVNMFKKTITSTQKDSLIINTDSQIKKTPK